MLAPTDISKLGIGTWGIGGFAEPDPHNDDARDVAGIKRWLSKGINYIEVPPWYAGGKTAELVAKAVKASGVPRSNLFIVLTIHPYSPQSAQDIYADFSQFCDLFNTNYADALQISMGGIKKWGLAETLTVVNDLLGKKSVRFLNLNNADKSVLSQIHRHFGDKLFGHELSFSFEIRANDDLGIMQYANQHGIRNVITQPLRRNRTAAHNWPLLVELSRKYGATQNQIIIAWMVALKMLPIPKSTTPAHIDELMGALDVQLDAQDISRLNTWRPESFTMPNIDWQRTQDPANGVAIDQLANVFDDEYRLQTSRK